MGQYLHKQYEERELAKTLAKVHGIIDEETQKLSDKLKNLTLSHNRKKKALKTMISIFRTMILSHGEVQVNSVTLSSDDIKKLITVCENALFSDGRAEIK